MEIEILTSVCIVLVAYMAGYGVGFSAGRSKQRDKTLVHVELLSRAMHMQSAVDHPSSWERCPADPCVRAREILATSGLGD